ncbi:hypothetical protein AFB00_04975 [Pseudonocardia sp. HH130630-07]|nr:hypothetical protein AFB00_04975 [Pseudonocardia sp. HH130630-07]
MVTELVSCGLLVSCLHAPSTVVDPVRHLRRTLDERGAPSSTVVESATIETRLAGTGPSERWAVDLALGTHLTLPTQVAQDVETAAALLARLVPWRHGHPGWQAYHAQFLDRFGAGAAVALGDVVDPVAGLGYPRHFVTGAAREPMTGRDETLLMLAQNAALAGDHEVVLTDADVDTLDPTPVAAGRAAPHLDVSVELRARSRAAVNDGDFLVVAVGVGRSGMATTGRFLDLLPAADRSRSIEALRGIPASVTGAVPVQLSFTPDQPRVGNVARAVQMLPTVLSVGEYGPAASTTDAAEEADVLGVRDLLVTADHDGLYLIDKNRGVLVEPVVACAVARHAMAPMVRFLTELPRATGSALSQFTWGAAEVLPFRPRLRYGRCVLSVARWRIDPATLPRAHASGETWRTEFARLRERLGLPAVVAVGTGDRRLRLDLDAAMDQDLMRDHLDRVGAPVTVAEAATERDWSWFGGRAHEIVVPLALDAGPAPAPVVSARPRVVIAPGHDIVPGSRLVSARVACAPGAIDTVLEAHLPALLEDIGEACPWWFVRTWAPFPQLRLRLPTERYGDVAERLGRWVDTLRKRGLAGDLLLDTYRPELARYTERGDTDAMSAAEAVFAADSAAARAQVVVTTRSTSTGVDRSALTAASLFDLTCALTGGRHAGARWLARRADLTGATPAVDRRVLGQVQALCSPAGPATVLADRDVEALTQVWRSRARAVAGYRRALAAGGGGSVPRDPIVVSLLHLHHVRACGPDTDREAAIVKLARSAALTVLAREHAPQEQR